MLPTTINAIEVSRSRSQKCSTPVSRNPTPKLNRNNATNVVLHGNPVRARPSGLLRNNSASLNRLDDVSYKSAGITSCANQIPICQTQSAVHSNLHHGMLSLEHLTSRYGSNVPLRFACMACCLFPVRITSTPSLFKTQRSLV